MQTESAIRQTSAASCSSARAAARQTRLHSHQPSWSQRWTVDGKDADCVSIDMGGLVALQLLDRLLEQRRRQRAVSAMIQL